MTETEKNDSIWPALLLIFIAISAAILLWSDFTAPTCNRMTQKDTGISHCEGKQ